MKSMKISDALKFLMARKIKSVFSLKIYSNQTVFFWFTLKQEQDNQILHVHHWRVNNPVVRPSEITRAPAKDGKLRNIKMDIIYANRKT